MPGTYPSYSANTQDTKYDIPNRPDIANAADYNAHDTEILKHQDVLIDLQGKIGQGSGTSGYSGYSGYSGFGLSGYSGYSGSGGGSDQKLQSDVTYYIAPTVYQAQVDTVTLSGFGGTLDISDAGGLTKTVTWNTDLNTTASYFVNDTGNIADYGAQGILLSTTGNADIIFTASVPGTPFTHPSVSAGGGSTTYSFNDIGEGANCFESITNDGTNVWAGYYPTTSSNSGLAKINPVDGTYVYYEITGIDHGNNEPVLVYASGYIWSFGRDNSTHDVMVSKVLPADGTYTSYDLGTDSAKVQSAIFDGTYIWATSDTGLYKITPSDGSSSYYAVDSLWAIAFDGTYIWTTTNGGNTLYQIGYSDGSIVNTYTLTGETNIESLQYDGTNLWAVTAGFNPGPADVLKISTADGTFTTYTMNSGECNVWYQQSTYFDGTYLWIMCAGGYGSSNSYLLKFNTTDNTHETFTLTPQGLSVITKVGSTFWAGQDNGPPIYYNKVGFSIGATVTNTAPNVTGNGSDSNDGSTDHPFATLQHAIDLIPKDLNGHSVNINLKNGSYVFDDTIISGFTSSTNQVHAAIDIHSDSWNPDDVNIAISYFYITGNQNGYFAFEAVTLQRKSPSTYIQIEDEYNSNCEIDFGTFGSSSYIFIHAAYSPVYVYSCISPQINLSVGSLGYVQDNVISPVIEYNGGILMDGNYFLTTPPSAPTTDYEVANKKYVDDNAGGIPDAASDGNLYARKNNSWLSFNPGISDATSDGNIYGRKNESWVVVTGIGSSSIAKKASENVRNSNNVISSASSVEYVKSGTITLTNGLLGTQRFIFHLWSSDISVTAYGQIWRNGSPLGTEQTSNSTNQEEKSQDITQDWLPGDKVELWFHGSNSSYYVYAAFLSISYDDDPTVASVNS